MRVRITLAAVLVVAAALAGGGAWIVRAHHASLVRSVDTAARLRSSDIAATIASGTLPTVLAIPPGDENLVQVVDRSGNVVAASANVEGDGAITGMGVGPSVAIETLKNLPIGDGHFRVLSRQVRTNNNLYSIFVAASLEPTNRSTTSLAQLLLVGLPFLLLVIGVVTWVVTGKALEPVEGIRQEVEAIGAADLNRRVPEPNNDDEIGRLARTMNAMLGRLEASTERQRRFVADASHELRSPLSGIRARLEVDLAHPAGADWQATERDVLDDAIRLQRLVEDLLVLAKSDGAPIDASSRTAVDLDEIVLTEARRLRARTDRHVDTTSVSGAQLLGNPDELARAVRNLVDNAARHASSTVTIGLTEDDDTVVLSVADDGPGIPVDQREIIFERFTRLGDGRERDAGGTGLGLAITHDVVTAHGGTIRVDDVPGARFVVHLPTSGRPAADA